MKDHSFGFIGDWCNKKRKGFSGIGDNGFKHFNGVNWSVGRVNYCSVSGKATIVVVGSWYKELEKLYLISKGGEYLFRSASPVVVSGTRVASGVDVVLLLEVMVA